MDFVDWDVVDRLEDQFLELFLLKLFCSGHHSLVKVALGAPPILFDS